MTIAKESRRIFAECKYYIKTGRNNTIPYLSGTLNKRTKMYKETKRYLEDAEIDFELGVINKTEHDAEVEAIRLFERALANYKVI